MKRDFVMTLSAILAVFIPSMVPAQDARLVGDRLVSSDSLGALVLGQKIRLMTHDGTYVEGKVLRANQKEIHMQVKTCMPKEWLAKGQLPGRERSLRTADITVVHLQKNGSPAISAALGVIGGYLGGAGAALAADRIHSRPAYFGAVLVSAATGAAAGALLGRKAARQTISIIVVP